MIKTRTSSLCSVSSHAVRYSPAAAAAPRSEGGGSDTSVWGELCPTTVSLLSGTAVKVPLLNQFWPGKTKSYYFFF